MGQQLLQEGDVIEIKHGMTVYADIPKHFVYMNKKGDWSLTHSVVCIDDNFKYLTGEYVVYKTVYDGGGTGHGSHDIYPDGYHVFCEHVTRKTLIDFYQTGAFSAKIEDISPISRAKKQWVYV